MIPHSEGGIAVEAQGLVGRIHKDRWKDSNLADTASLNCAIVSYRNAYSLAQARIFKGEKGVDVVFPGINLATLLVVRPSLPTLAHNYMLRVVGVYLLPSTWLGR